MFAPPPTSESVSAVVLGLVDAARNNSLVLCVGAGLSVADDACLPGGRELGRLLNERLDGHLTGYVKPDNVEDLIAVADAAVEPVGGEVALRAEVLQIAQFTKAPANYGHQVLALLLAEGALTVLSWNWDTCIERAAPSDEVLGIARTKDDMADLALPQLAKAHGSADMPPTLLVTSEHLAQPPLWADSSLDDRLRSSQVVFVGVGDIADYTRKRIRELVDGLNEPDIRIVSPSIMSDWETSEWGQVLPGLDEERRIGQTADEFLDELGRAWARQLSQALTAERDSLAEDKRPGIDKVVAALERMSATRLMRWCRAILVHPESGTSAIRLSEVGDAVLAAAVLASEDEVAVETPHPGCCAIDEERLELMACEERVAAADIRRAALRRAEDLASSGVDVNPEPRFLVGGTVTGRLDQSVALTDIVSGESNESTDVKDGPSSVSPVFLQASSVLAEAA